MLSNIELEQLPSFQLGMGKGYDQGMEQGIEQGIEQGKETERLDMAQQLLSLNLPLSQIRQVTGLSENQLQALMDDLGKPRQTP